METHLILTENGTFQPLTTPGELFARFNPQPKEPLSEDTARRMFALVKALDSEAGVREARVLTVFRLYCVEVRSTNEIARLCKCSKATIINRLRMIKERTGTEPKKLRAYSAQFESIAESLGDPRAKHIYRKGAAYGDEDTAESQGN